MSPRLERGVVVVAAAAVLLLLTAASFRRISEADFFWQYAAGELVASHGVPHVDGWSYVSQGRPWTEMRWLYCTLMHGIAKVAGFPALVVVKWLIVLATFGFAAAAGRAWRAPVATAAVIVAAILAASQRLYVRPEIASFLFVAVFTWIIVRHRERGGRLLWILPVLQALWANLHTQFLLGPALLGLLLVVEAGSLAWSRISGRATEPGARRRILIAGGAFVATSVACLATPYGVAGIQYGLELLRTLRDPVFREVSAELRPPYSIGVRFTAMVWFEILAGLTAVSVLVNIRRLDPFRFLFAISQLWLALTAIRNLPLFCLAAIPLAADNFARSSLWSRPAVRKLAPVARLSVLIATLAVSLIYTQRLVTDRFYVDQYDTNQFGAGLAQHRFPERAARFLRDHPIDGALFHPMFEGSYLVAQGFRDFIDPRLEVHGAEFIARYSKMARDADAWRDAEREFDFRAALVALDSPYVDRLTATSDWRLVEFDDVAAVFLRGTAAGDVPTLQTADQFAAAAERIRSALPAPPSYTAAGVMVRVASPIPYQRTADFLMRMGQARLAEPFARDALIAYPRAVGAHVLLGRILDERQDDEGALREYEAELQRTPNNQLARRRAGILNFKAGRTATALEQLTRSVEDVPNDAKAWSVLTKIHADAGRTQDALRCAAQAARLAPTDAGAAANFGRLQAVAGQTDGAIAALTSAAQLAPGDASVHRDLAVVLSQRRRYAEARAAIDRAAALAPGDPEIAKLRESIGNAARGASEDQR